jgi:hypothetical protein
MPAHGVILIRSYAAVGPGLFSCLSLAIAEAAAQADPLQDIFVVEVSDDSRDTWAEPNTVGPAGSKVNGGWLKKEFLVGDFVDLTDGFVIRFIATETNPQSVVEAGVDGVQLSRLDCGATPLGDLDGDGIVGITDFLILLAN